MAVTYKDIDQLSQKPSVAGTEKLPVSDTEYITPSQIVANDQKFYFVDGSSSHAGNSTSGSYLSTKWEGTIPGVTTLVNGLKIAYRIKTNTGVATAGAVLSIDGGTTYKPVVFNVNSVITTRYSVGSTILLTYNSTQTATAYLSSNTKSTVTGCWQIMDYDANTNTQVRQYQAGANADGTSPKYPLLARYDVTNKNGSYDTNYSRFHTGATLDTSTGDLEATSFIKTGGTSAQFLKADGSVDSNTYATTSQIPAAPGTLITNATVAQTASSGEAMSGSITLHKVAKTGTYSDLIGKPTIPSAPGTLNTTATTAQSTSSSEALSGSITLHKVAKTGTYSDLIGTPTIPTKVSDLQNDAGYTTNTGTITSVKMNGSTVASSGEANLGSIPKKVHLTDESNMPASPDSDTLYLIDESGESFVSATSAQNFSSGQKTQARANIGAVSYVLCADQSAYEAITTKASDTLYLIPKA